MPRNFYKNISPFVESEIRLAVEARKNADIASEFKHLESAHVIGQESTYWHVKVHALMFVWAIRNMRLKESIGQIFRIIGAATKTVFGLVPQGNTGGTNVSPFKTMPINSEHKKIIASAKRRL